jgi:hypothetical protein
MAEDREPIIKGRGPIIGRVAGGMQYAPDFLAFAPGRRQACGVYWMVIPYLSI